MAGELGFESILASRAVGANDSALDCNYCPDCYDCDPNCEECDSN